MESSGDEHLAGGCPRSDPRADVHGDPAQLVAEALALAGVDPRSDFETEWLHCGNHRFGAADCAGRPVEAGKEAVAGGVQLAASIEVEGRVVREGAHPHHIDAADRVAGDLVHSALRAWRLAPVGDLLRFGRSLLDRLDRRLDRGPDGCRGVLQVLGKGESGGGHWPSPPA